MFCPGITTTATEGRIFALAGQALRLGRGPAGDSIYVGDLDGEPCFAHAIDDASGTTPLRQLFGVLSDEEFGVAMRALALVAWDRDHKFCGRCGAPTERSREERVRECSACKFGVYPRIAPAVIVLVERDGKALLARNARFPIPFFSTLAGFVEVGETLEECVVREIREEAGIDVGDIRYFGSQPWPFGGSLMVGFTARWLAGELKLDPSELADADWYAPDALPMIPPRLSIARALIDDFVRRFS